MPSAQEEKIREIFERASSFALIFNRDAKEEVFLATEALKIFLQDKELKIYQHPETPKELKTKWLSILPAQKESLFLYSTSILIPKDKSAIQEISYDDDDKYVNINITSKNKEVAKENIVFKPKPLAIDAVFYFAGASGNEQISGEQLDYLSKKITIPKKEEIITIALSGEVVAEKIFNIINAIDPQAILEGTPIPNLLLVSLAIETNGLKDRFNEKTLGLASVLLKMGADKKFMDELAKKENSDSFTQILGRAMARTFTNESLKSAWTFLSLCDLEKTNNKEAGPPLFFRIMDNINDFMPPQLIFVLIWQTKRDVRAIINMKQNHSDAPEKIKNFLEAEENKGFLLCGPYKNFSEAEIKIQEALKKVI